jgi:hypothetical protein
MSRELAMESALKVGWLPSSSSLPQMQVEHLQQPTPCHSNCRSWYSSGRQSTAQGRKCKASACSGKSGLPRWVTSKRCGMGNHGYGDWETPLTGFPSRHVHAQPHASACDLLGDMIRETKYIQFCKSKNRTRISGNHSEPRTSTSASYKLNQTLHTSVLWFPQTIPHPPHLSRAYKHAFKGQSNFCPQ